MTQLKPYPQFEAPAPVAPVSIPKPIGYHVIVEPRRPASKSAGGIALPAKTRRANRATEYIGKLVGVGEFAWHAKTPEIDWSTLKGRPAIGDWVIYKLHAGQKLRIHQAQAAMIAEEGEDEDFLLIMFDTDIIGAFENEEEAARFYSWVK